MNHVEPVPGGTSESGGLPRPHRGRSHQLVRGLSLGVLGLVLAGNTIAKDLIGVYEDALRNDPQLRAADANRLASRESRPQALAALLPQISGTAAYTRDHTGATTSQPAQALTGQVYVAVIPFTNGSAEKQWALNLRQNLFSWQNWVTLKESNSQVAQAEATYAAAEQNLIFRVSQAYFNLSLIHI